jgi:hypothetical protein
METLLKNKLLDFLISLWKLEWFFPFLKKTYSNKLATYSQKPGVNQHPRWYYGKKKSQNPFYKISKY